MSRDVIRDSLEFPEESFGFPQGRESASKEIIISYFALRRAQDLAGRFLAEILINEGGEMKLFGLVVRWFRRRFMVPTAEHYVVTLAKIDLSNRLGVSRELIKVVEVRRVDWPDTSLGHPEPGKVYAQVITPGFVIKLAVSRKLCEYRADYTRIVFVGCKTTS